MKLKKINPTPLGVAKVASSEISKKLDESKTLDKLSNENIIKHSKSLLQELKGLKKAKPRKVKKINKVKKGKAWQKR